MYLWLSHLKNCVFWLFAFCCLRNKLQCINILSKFHLFCFLCFSWARDLTIRWLQWKQKLTSAYFTPVSLLDSPNPVWLMVRSLPDTTGSVLEDHSLRTTQYWREVVTGWPSGEQECLSQTHLSVLVTTKTWYLEENARHCQEAMLDGLWPERRNLQIQRDLHLHGLGNLDIGYRKALCFIFTN